MEKVKKRTYADDELLESEELSDSLSETLRGMATSHLAVRFCALHLGNI